MQLALFFWYYDAAAQRFVGQIGLLGLILEKDNQDHMYIVYCPAIKAFNPVKCWDSSWLVMLSDEN